MCHSQLGLEHKNYVKARGGGRYRREPQLVSSSGFLNRGFKRAVSRVDWLFE